MSDHFNPYSQWLELDAQIAPTAESSPDFYQLLGLPTFENDPQRIIRAADKAQAKVRAHRPGAHAAQWAKLLDLLKEVRATLTDSQRKQQYDARLRQQSGGESLPRVTASEDPPFTAPEQAAAPSIEEAAASKFAATTTAHPHSWPPGMAPPENHAPPLGTPPGETQPQSPLESEALPPGESAAPTDPDAIPLSARWPIPGPQEIPNTARSSPSPESSSIENRPAPSNGSAAVPLAVPLSALHPAGGPLPTAGVAPLAKPVAGSHPVPDPMAPVAATWNQPREPAVPMGTAVPASAPESPMPSPDWQPADNHAPETQLAARGEGASPRKRTKSSPATTMLLTLATVAILIVLGVVVLGDWDGEADPQDVAQSNPSQSGTDLDQVDLRPLNTSDIPPRSTPPKEPTTLPTETPDPPTTDPDMNPPPVVDTPPPEPRPTPPLVDTPPSESMPADPVVPETPPEPMPTPPEPAPVVPVPPKAVPPTAAEVAQLSKLMTTARQALTDQNVPEAKLAADQAVALAKAPAHVAKAARLQMLVTLVSEFWRAVDESIQGLEGGDVITIGTTQVAVVEVRPDLLIIRVEGQNKRYPRSDMSEGLAMGLAINWLDKDSEITPLVRGAFYAIARNQKPDDAREQWNQAAAKGADVGDLPLVLTDKYDEETLMAEATAAMAAEPRTALKVSSEPLSDADKQSLATALRNARQALSRGQMADADAQLTIAGNIAAGSDLEPVVQRTQELARHLRGFWDAVALGMESLSEGSVVKVGSTEITVVSSSRDEISYTVVGQQLTHRRTELPAGLAMAIAKTSLPSDLASSSLQRGAFYAVHPKADPADARKAWNEAAAAGAEVSQLMLTLEDTYEW